MTLIAKDCNLIIHSPKIIHRFYCDEIHDDKIYFQIISLDQEILLIPNLYDSEVFV